MTEFVFDTKIVRLWNYQRWYLRLSNFTLIFFLIFLKIKIPLCPLFRYYTGHLGISIFNKTSSVSEEMMTFLALYQVFDYLRWGNGAVELL